MLNIVLQYSVERTKESKPILKQPSFLSLISADLPFDLRDDGTNPIDSEDFLPQPVLDRINARSVCDSSSVMDMEETQVSDLLMEENPFECIRNTGNAQIQLFKSESDSDMEME